MSMTIQVDEALAQLLSAKASLRHLTPQELAVLLLGEAVKQLEHSDQWQSLNDRRFALIDKRRTVGLTAAEQAELTRLKAEAAEQLEPFDDLLLERLARVEERIDGIRAWPCGK